MLSQINGPIEVSVPHIVVVRDQHDGAIRHSIVVPKNREMKHSHTYTGS